MGGLKKRAVFLDRDGVLVVPEFRNGRSYAPTTLEGFHLYPNIEQSLLALKQAGFAIVVVTNQPDVGRGIISENILSSMHGLMCSALPIDDIRVCRHAREDACSCRKPKAGMLIDAARAGGFSLSESFMVGDRTSDIAAGKEAGCRTIFVDLAYESELKPDYADWSVSSLQEAAQVILAENHRERKP